MESSQTFRPLIKLPTSFGYQILSKHLVIEIFGLAFSKEKVFTCFKMLNKNFKAFTVSHFDLIEKLTVDGLLDTIKMRVLIRNQYDIDNILI